MLKGGGGGKRFSIPGLGNGLQGWGLSFRFAEPQALHPATKGEGSTLNRGFLTLTICRIPKPKPPLSVSVKEVVRIQGFY